MEALKEGWTAHTQDICPVPEGTLIDIRHRDGSEHPLVEALCGYDNADGSNWIYSDGCDGDIIAWRLSETNKENEMEALKDGWIINSGECHLEIGTLVDVKFRQGDIEVGRYCTDWSWHYSKNKDYNHDIVDWRLSGVALDTTVKPTTDKPIVSDGSSSSYYTFDITNKAGQTITVEVGDVCRAMVDNDFDLSNIIKATRRLSEASKGRGKAGASIEYDCNKMVYFSNEFKHWNK